MGLGIILVIDLKLKYVYTMTYLVFLMIMKCVFSTNNTNKDLELQIRKTDMNVSVRYCEITISIKYLIQCLTLLYYIESIIPATYRNEFNDMCKSKRFYTTTCMSNHNLVHLFPKAFQLYYTIKSFTCYLRNSDETHSQRITLSHILSLWWLYIASYYLILFKPP